MKVVTGKFDRVEIALCGAVLLYFVILITTDHLLLKYNWTNLLNVIAICAALRFLDVASLLKLLAGLLIAALVLIGTVYLKVFTFNAPLKVGVFYGVMDWIAPLISSALAAFYLVGEKSFWTRALWTALCVFCLTYVIDPVGYHWHLWLWPSSPGSIPWWSSLPWLLMGFSVAGLPRSKQKGSPYLFLTFWVCYSALSIYYGFPEKALASSIILTIALVIFKKRSATTSS